MVIVIKYCSKCDVIDFKESKPMGKLCTFCGRIMRIITFSSEELEKWGAIR